MGSSTNAEPTLDRNGLEILDRDQCLRLLSGARLGRVGILTHGVPAVLPVAFAIDGDRIVFASTPGTKLYTALDRTEVAFEVDELDPDDYTGWSVCVVGKGSVLGGADAERARRLLRGPWTDRPNASFVAIDCRTVSGRRAASAARRTPSGPGE